MVKKNFDWRENKDMNEKYKDMLHLPHPVSVSHPRMSLQDRAAQFSPFAALTGYEDALRETARQTEQFIELEEDKKQEINRQICYLQQHRNEKMIVKITYFVQDMRKSGGTYNVLEGYVYRIDENNRSLRICETEILIDRIYQIDFL